MVLEHGGQHGVAGADLDDHLEVGLQVEQRGQRAAHQRLVVGEQQPDGHARTTLSEKPGESSRVTTVAPTSAARSRSPASPEPWPSADGAAAPSSRTSALVGGEHDLAVLRAASGGSRW